MKHWGQYFRKLKIMESPLTSLSVNLAINKLPSMVTNLTRVITPQKVQAIHECKPPQLKAEVRSFLCMTGYLSKFIPRYASLTKPLWELTHKQAKFHWGREEDDAFEELKANISSKDTMAFFNPKLPIMVRVEASYNEGLSAGLFQQSARGWQPVHFISRTLTDVEKRYNQTDKDALCVKWAKD